ncbi:molecular chaperone GroEL [Methylomonas sp. LWB]|uniref:chaperonin GroEL n=1 Tax=Methylomonas sp. LWB TaxID=1905845 RepID=UPI0008D99161|nr:chaperonin GroEL [Methylomonas sp. LWB]OHX34190.1 molecular chaperone GroEL [Methylomonas sp. LWB]
MSKQIIYNPEARLRIMQGMDTVARAAAATLGSSGPAVLIQHRTDGMPPIFTRDGVTVANSIILEDRVADLGGRMLRDVAGSVSRQVGDGTTTAIVLARAIAAECLKSVAAGFHPLQLQKGLDLALTLVEIELRRRALTDVTPEWIARIAAVASKDEPGVGTLLNRAFAELGQDGPLTFQLGNGRDDELDIVEGIRYDQGYLSPYFVTDRNRATAELERPYILLCDREIVDLMDLVPILEQVADQHRSLLVIADDVRDNALTGMLLNHIRGVFKTVAVKPPGFGDRRLERLNDLALLTGATPVLQSHGTRLEDLTLAQLGQAERAIVGAETTTILAGAGDSEAVARVVSGLRQALADVRARKPGDGSPTGNQHEADELEERIAMLSGKTGVFSVGGVTDIEIKERMVRIENAYKSVQAALEEGVMPGGGAGLVAVAAVLDEVIAENAEQHRGVAILSQALFAPLRQILSNAGLNGEIVAADLRRYAGESYAYDTQRQRLGPFLDIGIIDPVKVVRLGLRNAVSIVGTLMASESVVMDVPDPAIMAGYSPEWAAATREDPRA